MFSRKVFISISLVFALPLFTNAFIDHPYVVDEKPQVLFGDSIEVDGHYGLENYTQDYVGGFAHFTFTYTHHQCCFASYPPLAYITNIDPRSTTTPAVQKWAYYPYNIPSFSGIPSDWYLYDIQFDATGYVTSVKEQGTSTQIYFAHSDPIDGFTPLTDWVALANHYPVFNGVTSIHSMAFTPLPIKEPEPLPPENSDPNPVIIIPGIMGSAYKNDELVIDPILHTYDDLLATLDQNGYTPNVDLFTFPYEWRDSNILNADLLKNKISEVIANCFAANPDLLALSSSKCDKVDLVAHSMGGLVARAYIQSVDYASDVDQLIFLGTPHKGSPKDYLAWEAGEFPPGAQEFLIEQIFASEARRNGFSSVYDYVHNRPILSVQELLPTFDYLEDDSTEILRTYPNNYPQNTFLENLNNNISNLLDSGVKITNMIGNTGSNTIEKVIVSTPEANKWIHGKAQSFDYGAGDDTVTLFGSTLDNSIPNEEWSNVTHIRLPRETQARVFDILTGHPADNVIFLSTIEKIFMIQLQSPIDVVVTAPDGKKIGKNFSNGNEYNEIPDAFYSGYNNNDNEYVTIPNPLDGEYKIELQGTGNGGEYGVLTSYISDEFATTTETTGITAPDQITNLEVVVNNTNPEDLETEREVTIDVLINDINGAYNLGWITNKKVRDGLIAEAKVIIKFEKKKNGKYEKKVDKILIKLIEKELDLLKKKGKINQQAYDLLKTDLEYIINNN